MNLIRLLRTKRERSKSNNKITQKKGGQIQDGYHNNQAGRDINIYPAKPSVIQVPMVGEQAKIAFNELMKPYGCPVDNDEYGYNPKFLNEVNIARNEFIKWAQDNSDDGATLPLYKDQNAKAKELWTKYVKSSPSPKGK